MGDAIFDKYGLGNLKDRRLSLWTEDDYENVISACIKENMAPQLPLLFNSENIERLMKHSHCRECGLCCGWGPHPISPHSQGVFLFESELKKIEQESKYKRDRLIRIATKHESHPGAWYLPFPCVFRKNERCEIYQARPFPCHTYPLSNYLLNGKYYIAVSVQCKYGSDIYKAVLRELSRNERDAKELSYE